MIQKKKKCNMLLGIPPTYHEISRSVSGNVTAFYFPKYHMESPQTDKWTIHLSVNQEEHAAGIMTWRI